MRKSDLGRVGSLRVVVGVPDDNRRKVARFLDSTVGTRRDHFQFGAAKPQFAP